MSKLIVAVSGGVDSVSLLHSLKIQDGFANIQKPFSTRELVVAHFDHGIREDSTADRRFVEELANLYQLDFVYEQAPLGKNASETIARKARWDFLNKISDGSIIATAHHADDRLETQIINLLRGTSRKGLSALNQTDFILRPLLQRTKTQVYDYALQNNLEWVEDSTNFSDHNLRNRIRHHLVPKLKDSNIRQKIDQVDQLNPQIDQLLEQIYQKMLVGSKLSRKMIAPLPKNIRLELIARYISQFKTPSSKQTINKKQIELIDSWLISKKKKDTRDLAGAITFEMDPNSIWITTKK